LHKISHLNNTFKQIYYYYSLTNFYQGLARGPIDHKSSSVINLIANEAIGMGSVVTQLATIPTDELIARVEEGDSATDIGYGIAVGGDADGIYATDGAVPTDDTTRATASAGEGIVVVTQGRCLARVDGNAAAIVVGDPLRASATAGKLEKADAAADYIIARALQPSVLAIDIIAVDVQREGLFT